MKIGLLITSFLQGKLNLTTTSTIFSPYVDHAMEESRTAYFNGSHGGTPGTNKGRGWRIKTVGVRLARVLNDLLPYSLRPIKSGRRRRRVGYTLGIELYTLRLVWRSHHWPRLRAKLRKLMESGKVWWK
jgi:hypothetical protein